MSLTFTGLLSRADGPQLSRMMPPGAAQLLAAIDQQLAYPRNLVKVLLTLRSPEDLLLNAGTREELLQLLPIPDAELLAVQLGKKLGTDPYQFLLSTVFTKASKSDVLLAFFKVDRHPSDIKEIGPSDSVVEANYPLFPHQVTAALAIREKLSKDPFRALLHMPTGAGKTRTAMNIIADYLRERESGVVVWLAHSEELCQQAEVEFEAAWQILGNRRLRVARYYGKYDSDLTTIRDGIVIAGLAKAFSRLKRDDKHLRALSARSPFVVMDEAHQAIAPTYRQIIELMVRPFTGARLLGLSATPGRTWNDPNADAQLSDFFGRQKVSLSVAGYDNPVDYLIQENYLAKPKFRQISVDSKIKLSAAEQRAIEETFDLPKSVLEKLGRNQSRNLQIIAEIETLMRSHKRILLFASSVDQSEVLTGVLSARGYQAWSVSSNSSHAQRKAAISAYLANDDEPKILCNFGVLTTGFDAPKTSAAVIARPTLSLVLYSQMIGRAMRGTRAGGNKEAEIVTVVDPSLPGFDSVERAFSNWEDVWNKKGE